MLEQPTFIEDQLEDIKSEEISYRNLHVPAFIHDKKSNSTIKIPYMSITNKYKDYLSSIVTSIDLLESEQRAYYYKPKALSLFLYGTTELWYAIMELNNMKSVIEFNKPTLKLYDPKQLKDMINEIMILEGILV